MINKYINISLLHTKKHGLSAGSIPVGSDFLSLGVYKVTNLTKHRDLIEL